MRAALFLTLSLCLPRPASAFLAPTGEIVWGLSVDSANAALVVDASGTARLALFNPLFSGPAFSGTAVSASTTLDVSGSALHLTATFPPFALWLIVGAPPSSSPETVELDLVDLDGTPFAGGGLPANPPSLDTFETATLSLPTLICPNFDPYDCGYVLAPHAIRVLPEPGISVVLLGPLALLVRRKRPPDS